MKRVFITGASGFIGYECLHPLVERGYEVHALTRSSLDNTSDQIHWHEVNLLDSHQMRRVMREVHPTHLLHLAWYLEPGSFYEASENCSWVRASLELMEAFKESGGERCVMVGTGYEYDLRYGFCTENLTPCSPTTVYGQTKYAMQQLLAAYSRASDLNSAWARVFFLYGPREKPSRLVASVVRSLLLKEPAHCSSGDQIRDYLHVNDAAVALICLLDSDIRGVVNIGSGRPATIRNIVTKIGELMERPDLIRLGALQDNVDAPVMAVASVSRLMDEVGWRPHYDLETGLKDTIDWWITTNGHISR